MKKILEILKSLGEKWKGLTLPKRVSIVLITTTIISAVILIFAYLNRVTYATLFTNLEAEDSARIYEKLKSDKVPVKIEGDSILVPEDRVDDLRMSVISEGISPSKGKGWELFDEGSFGITDTEAKVMYQRALEGELSRTISSFDQVENAIVHLVLPEDSVFARENEEARASVTVKLKSGKNLEESQVKAIVSLVSGSVKNLPKENIEVVDNYMNVLSENLFDTPSPGGGTTATDKQLAFEKQFEAGLENDVKEMLATVFGRERVSVKVNADLDFDSRQITTIKYDPNPIVVSTKKLKESATDSQGSGKGSSPVDDQYSPTIPSDSGTTSGSTREEETTNYNVGQTEETVIKAPGEVRKMTVSVVIDDANLSEADREAVANIVATATGYDEERGDKISVQAMAFNTDDKKAREEALANAQKQLEEAQKRKRMYTYIGIGVSAAVLIVLIILVSRKISKRRKDDEITPNLDVVIGENIIPKQPIAYDPVLDDSEEVMDIEKEIKNYANKKPDQVVDLIKTWLSDDER